MGQVWDLELEKPDSKLQLPLLAGCVTLGELLNLSELPFLQYNGSQKERVS